MARDIRGMINYIYWNKDATLVTLPNDEWIKKYQECQENGKTPVSQSIRHDWYECAKAAGIAYRVQISGKYKELRVFTFDGGYTRYSTNSIDPHKDGRAGTEAIQTFLKYFAETYGGEKSDSRYFSTVFGTSPAEIKECVPKQFYWIDENLKGKTLKNVSSVDDSAHYPSCACGRMPDANTALTIGGEIEPNKEYPFAFYIKSGHFHELDGVDTRKWLNSPYMMALFDWDGIRRKKRPIDPYLNPEQDVTVLMKAAPLTLDKTWQHFYALRNEDETAKLVMNAVIGNWHRKRYQNYKYAHLAVVTIARANQKMHDEAERIGFSRIIHICVDGCIYIGAAAESTEKMFGRFRQEFEKCEFSMVAMNCYMVLKGGELVKYKHGAYNVYDDGTPIEGNPPKNFSDMLRWRKQNALEECI